MTRISLLKLVIPILVAFLVGLQFNPLFFRSGFNGSGGGHYRIDTDDCIDCPDLPQRDTYAYTVSNSHSNVDDIKIKQPSYLKWSTKKPRTNNWTYATPMFVNPSTKGFPPEPNKTIIVHYHMQHNAGTSFYIIARQFTVATRACWQTSKHCSVSYNEEVEAENIRDNYQQHGLQYISYEYMLPPRFPLPFVSESAREGLFFTTIMRNPMNRLITWARSKRYKPHQRGAPPENFWKDVNGKSGVYERENLNVRWLSGALETITEDHVNIAKCRLQLFDLVIVDTTYDAAVNDVVCPLNNWQGGKFCNSTQARGEHKSKKINPLNETDSHFVGAWIERLRPSFELYDYARILSYVQLKERGVKDIPEMSEVPSYIDTLERYTNIKLNTPKESLVSLKNIDRFHPPKEFCDSLKKVWGSNADEVPHINGIGALDPQ